MNQSFMSLSQQIRTGVSIEEISDTLNQLSATDRLTQSRSLGPRDQRKLWEMCEGRAVTLDQIVPRDRTGQTVRHLGRNTLPVFKIFEKRFHRPSDDHPTLWGYNEGATRGLVGPGYFVCRESDQPEIGSVVVDYEMLPEEAPEGWPVIKSNERGVSRLVYAFMHDYLRSVSEHVTIGRAYRKGAESPNYFTLCRWDEDAT